MAEKAIDLDDLQSVVGKPPRRYPSGDERNLARGQWIQHATRALGLLIDLNDMRNGDAERMRKHADKAHLDGNHAAAAKAKLYRQLSEPHRKRGAE